MTQALPGWMKDVNELERLNDSLHQIVEAMETLGMTGAKAVEAARLVLVARVMELEKKDG